jgi:hypothetical protein
MANANGTFSGSTDLLVKLNTFMTGNGWTKLKGETDIAPASPKSARYWRIVVLDPENGGDNHEIRSLEWRTTTGGANQATTAGNYSISSVIQGGGADLISGSTNTRSDDIDDSVWVISYDFGSATIIRELVIRAGEDTRAPGIFYVQWSNDNEVWMMMARYSGQSWSDNETKTFTWDTGSGYTDSYHVSSTIGRRSGYSDSALGGSSFTKYNQDADNIWCWQGDGYDADRRVYISMVNYCDPVGGTDHVRITAHTGYDGDVLRKEWFLNQEGTPLGDGQNDSYFLADSDSGEYWFYLNDTRLFIVIKNGVADYNSAYIGFLAAFATPDDWPFPLYVGAACKDATEYLSDASAAVRDAVDPGTEGRAKYRRWDNDWQSVGNHQDVDATNRPVQNPTCWTWPYHVGQTYGGGSINLPNQVVGNPNGFDFHFLDHIDPTEQGDLPLFPVIVTQDSDGNVGALDGIFCVPRGGVLAPEQVLTISSVDYRVFSTRAKTGGHNFYAVRED